MQKVIQYMKKGFFLGIGMSMGLSIFLIGLFFVKGTDPLTATDGETLTAAKWNALVSNVQGVPVGTILAWHKNLDGVGSLPTGRVECNGQTLSDAQSSLNGKTMPDLNNPPDGYNGGRFLRGGLISGVMQEATSVRHQDWFYRQELTLNSDGLYSPGSLDYYNSLLGPGSSGSTQQYSKVRPLNMSVVWIMKVK